MDSKFKKAESWKEFYTNFNEYIIVLSESRDSNQEAEDRNETYNMIVKDWAEYSAVNKSYILDGPRELKNKINKQMLYLIVQEHEILNYFLVIFVHVKNEEENFSQLRTWIDNEFANQESMKKEVSEYPTCESLSPSGRKDDVPVENDSVESDSGVKEEKGNLEQVVTDTLIDGAKLIGNLVGAVGHDIKNFSAEIGSINKPRLVKVKVVGPKKLDFLSSILDFLPSEEAGVIETELDDYDVGIYAFDHDNWGNLDNVQEELPIGKYRIACNIGPSQGDIYMEPIFFEVWELEMYTKQDILSKLIAFA